MTVNDSTAVIDFSQKQLITFSSAADNVTRFKNKKSPNFSISSLKSNHSSFYLKRMQNQSIQIVNKYLDNLSEKLCHKNLSKIAQSGHTGLTPMSMFAKTGLSSLEGFVCRISMMERQTAVKCVFNLKRERLLKPFYQGGSPGLVVMEGDSCSKGRGFEFRLRILDGHFFTFICCKSCNVCL